VQNRNEIIRAIGTACKAMARGTRGDNEPGGASGVAARTGFPDGQRGEMDISIAGSDRWHLPSVAVEGGCACSSCLVVFVKGLVMLRLLSKALG